MATVGGQLAAEQHQLMLARNRIEAVWPVMKSNYNLIYHRARNVTGMSRHLLKLNCIDISNFAALRHQTILPNKLTFSSEGQIEFRL